MAHLGLKNADGAGVDPLTIQQLGGWKTLQMVQRYADLSPDNKWAA
jgi:hypothetical protein